MITAKNIISLISFVLIGLLVPLSAQDDVDARWDAIDDLNDAKDFDGAYELLQPMEAEYSAANDYLWRMARHHFNMSDNATDEAVISAEIYKGMEYATKALDVAPNSSWAHGYYGILIGRVGEIEGTKQKIINSYQVKAHTLKAIELDPTYDGWYHVMGRWHFALSDLSWIERTVANLVYETLPEASFAEGAEFFKKAIELEPEDIRHYLWLGKTQLEMDLDEAAQATLTKAIELPAESESDSIMQAEAKELLD